MSTYTPHSLFSLWPLQKRQTSLPFKAAPGRAQRISAGRVTSPASLAARVRDARGNVSFPSHELEPESESEASNRKEDAQHKIHSGEGGDSDVQTPVATPSAQHCGVTSESHHDCVQLRGNDASSVLHSSSVVVPGSCFRTQKFCEFPVLLDKFIFLHVAELISV